MTQQQSPYYRTQLSTKISLQPSQIGYDIDEHILNNLKIKVEKKTNEYGFVISVIRIISYGYGAIDKVNFMGVTEIPVVYECFICSPVAGMNIVCKYIDIVKGIIINENGPMLVIVEINRIDFKKFEIREKEIFNIEENRALAFGSLLKVSIINITHNLGEANIHVLAKLINVPTAEEEEEYKRDQLLFTGGTHGDEDIFI